MSWLWGRIWQRVESQRHDDAERLGYFSDGFQMVVKALHRGAAEAGAEFMLDTPVERLSHDGSTGEVLVDVDGSTARYDQVLVTVSSSVFARLAANYETADPAYFKQLWSISYLDAVVQVFCTEQPITPYYWHNINTPNSPFVVFLNLTALIGTERFGGKHVYYIGDYVPREHWTVTADEDEIHDAWYGELARMFPDFDRAQVLEDAVFRFRDAQHVVDVDFESKLPAHETPVPGVWLANFSQIYPMDRGTNYAVRDGLRMADGILSKLNGTPQPQPREE